MDSTTVFSSPLLSASPHAPLCARGDQEMEPPHVLATGAPVRQSEQGGHATQLSADTRFSGAQTDGLDDAMDALGSLGTSLNLSGNAPDSTNDNGGFHPFQRATTIAHTSWG